MFFHLLQSRAQLIQLLLYHGTLIIKFTIRWLAGSGTVGTITELRLALALLSWIWARIGISKTNSHCSHPKSIIIFFD